MPELACWKKIEFLISLCHQVLGLVFRYDFSSGLHTLVSDIQNMPNCKSLLNLLVKSCNWISKTRVPLCMSPAKLNSIIDNKLVYNHLRYYQIHVSVSLLPDHLTTCLLTSQLYNIHPGAAKRSIRCEGPIPVLYHQGAAFCAPNFPSQTPLEPRARLAAWLAGGRVHRAGCVWPEKAGLTTGEAEMVCGETLQAGGNHTNHQLGLDKTVCGAVSFEQRLNVMRIIYSLSIFSKNIFTRFVHSLTRPSSESNDRAVSHHLFNREYISRHRLPPTDHRHRHGHGRHGTINDFPPKQI